MMGFFRCNWHRRPGHFASADESAFEVSDSLPGDQELLRTDSWKLTKQARLWLLGALLLASECAYLTLLRLNATNGLRPVLNFLALLGALFTLYALAFFLVRGVREPSREMLLIIAVGALLFRLTLLPAGCPHEASSRTLLAGMREDVRGESVYFERFQLFDDDVWRYLWDGHVWTHHGNPYAFAPNDPALDRFADEDNRDLTDHRPIWNDVRDNIPESDVHTIYPPLGQGVFRLAHDIAPGSVLVLKSSMVIMDLLAAVFLAFALAAAGLPVEWVLLYAWNPLVIKAFAASGHSDAIAVAAIAALAYFLLKGAKFAAGASFALAVLAKLIPIVLFPFVARRIGWRNSIVALLMIFLGYVPFLGAGRSLFAGVSSYARFWQFNSGPFALVQWIAGAFRPDPSRDARLFMLFAVACVIAWLTWRDDGSNDSLLQNAALSLGAFIVLSPAVMPWYLTLVLPLAILCGQRIWIWFSAIVCFAFFVMVDQHLPVWALCLEYGLFAALLLYERYSVKRCANRRNMLALT
jgi:alpha-1,6-mannosyltransferase